MKPDLLILRPEPGASETARRAAELGLSAILAPLFRIEPVAWEAPDPSYFDALLLTSANAARQAGPKLGNFLGLRCYAVGDGTGSVASQAGFADIVTGPGDGQALIDRMAQDGMKRAFHPCGRDHVELASGEIEMERRIVYASIPTDRLPPAAMAAITAGALVLLHSPRAGALFAALAGQAGMARRSIGLAAISAAAAVAAGPGWKHLSIAPAPRDHALLELAARLCKTGGASYGK